MWEGTSLIDHPRRQAIHRPDAIAVSDPAGGWTWSQLDARADAWAASLADHRVGPGDRVALLAGNDREFFALLFGCLRRGAVLAPLNWRLAPVELEDLLALARPRVLLHDDKYAATAAGLRRPRRCALAPAVPGPARQARGSASPTDPGRELDEQDIPSRELDEQDIPSRELDEQDIPSRELDEQADPEHPALLLFTSGTTGRPKAAVLPVRQLFWNGINTAQAFGLTRDDGTLVFTPLFHTGGINVLAMPLLQLGGRVTVQPAFDPAQVVEALRGGGVSALFGVPVIFRLLAGEPGFWEAAATLRLCLCGGAPLPVSLIHRYRAHGLTLTQGFGMTEAGPNCFHLPPEEALTCAGAVGRPMPYADARVLREDGSDAGDDEVGELILRGPHVFSGYHDAALATAEALPDGWLRTGDLVRRAPDGLFYVAGRRKDMFISGGENVYPAEVEAALVAHPEIQEAAVLPQPDPRWGEVGRAVIAAVPGARPDPGALRVFLRERLAGYKIPRTFDFIDALPRSATGKVDKAALQQGGEDAA
jgi:fatty-acyl-CoA synthase